MTPIEDHPLRYQLTNELHARPFPVLTVPGTAVFLAVKQAPDAVARDRGLDLTHLIALLDRFGAPHPPPGATHYSGQIGRHVLKWEQHTEFVTYTVFTDGLSARAFDPADFAVFPQDWLADMPGTRLTSALMRIEAHDGDATAIKRHIRDWFEPESMAIAEVLDQSAVIASDFRIDPTGHSRIAVFVPATTGKRRVGRIVQRLFEIETYKTMAMLGLPVARDLGAEMNRLEERLVDLVADLRRPDANAAGTLDALLEVSAELEHMAMRHGYRFSATVAYSALVKQRIEVLRETRFLGRQSFREFMMRRFDPAMRTCLSTAARLENLTVRAERAGNLLRTRVDVERSEQNQKVLQSMNRRADLQLRLQRTVEGLSVVAISYYAVSLAGYLLYPLTEPLQVSKGMITAVVTVPVVGVVWWLIRRVHKRMH